jgi:hypothetical protein
MIEVACFNEHRYSLVCEAEFFLPAESPPPHMINGSYCLSEVAIIVNLRYLLHKRVLCSMPVSFLQYNTVENILLHVL